MIHGRIKIKERDEILSDFRKGKYDILVATPVVEVGIDIPNATIIVIEAAERFGLAQLHQLRGRVGRGEKESYCLLFTDSKNEKTEKRLRLLEQVYIGATLAEYDLKLRGPGEIYGKLQHGAPDLKVASFSDFNLIKKTRDAAEKILPDLSKYPKILNAIEGKTESFVSPD